MGRFQKQSSVCGFSNVKAYEFPIQVFIHGYEYLTTADGAMCLVSGCSISHAVGTDRGRGAVLRIRGYRYLSCLVVCLECRHYSVNLSHSLVDFMSAFDALTRHWLGGGEYRPPP